jgi:putative copper resistance protein D
VADPLIYIRGVHFAATLTLAGAVIFGAAVVGPVMRHMEGAGEALRARLLRIAWWSFAAALISGVAWLVVLAADISERAPSEAFIGGIVWTVLLHTTFGHDWLARLVLAALLAAALGWISPKHVDLPRWAMAALLACAFAAALVHSGHAAATAGWLGTFHRAADGLHLIAASAWLGGLLPLALLLTAARHEEISLALARKATLRFSTLGLISVGVLIATGIVNGWILTGSVPALIGTDYGRLLLAKVALFVTMVAIAAINRLWLTPRLALTATSPRCGEALLHEQAANEAPAAARTALRALARNSVMEAMLGLAILVIVGALGTTPPGLHVLQPTWPFAVRYSGAAFSDAELHATIALAMWAISGGLLCGALLTLIGAKVRRTHPRLTPWLIAAGAAVAIACVAHFAPTLTLATVEAYPTSFYIAPTGYSASSIVRGAKLFATHCASCHGREGRGDGPAGRFLRVKPSDLTADHVYGHTDGDLYWWITNGIREVMPPFALALDEEARWNVIDFVYANADAARLGRAGGTVTNAGYRAPDFSAACPDGSTVSRDRLRGRVGHLVLAGRDSTERVAQLAAHERDVVTIVIPLADVATGTACRADDGELATVLAMFGGKDGGRSDGMEFLVDPAGMLRAAWSPGGKPDWREADVLEREIAAIRNTPAATPTTGSHLHCR